MWQTNPSKKQNIYEYINRLASAVRLIANVFFIVRTDGRDDRQRIKDGARERPLLLHLAVRLPSQFDRLHNRLLIVVYALAYSATNRQIEVRFNFICILAPPIYGRPGAVDQVLRALSHLHFVVLAAVVGEHVGAGQIPEALGERTTCGLDVGYALVVVVTFDGDEHEGAWDEGR